jgi:hypothetical protein
LSRSLAGAGIRCEVAASSKLQRPAGDRVKTDARDALYLARMLRLDEVVAVRVPSEVEESALLMAGPGAVPGGGPGGPDAGRPPIPHRLLKLLLRHGIVYSGGKAWTQAHDYWLLKQSFPLAGTQAAFQDAYETVVLAAGRRDRFDVKIVEMAAESQFTPVVRRLSCLRGISMLTAFSLAVEIGDWDRFTGGGIGAYLGLVPSEHSPGRAARKARSPRPARPRASAAGRGGLASPLTVPADRDPAPPLAAGIPGSRRPGAGGKPPAAPAVGRLQRTSEAPRDRQRRRRPRARRLVLVPGHDPRLSAPKLTVGVSHPSPAA